MRKVEVKQHARNRTHLAGQLTAARVTGATLGAVNVVNPQLLADGLARPHAVLRADAVLAALRAAAASGLQQSRARLRSA